MIATDFKLKVRTKETRPVSFEFGCMVKLSMCTDLPYLKAMIDDRLDEMGYVYNTLNWNTIDQRWYATFHTIRDAFAGETIDWHIRNVPSKCVGTDYYNDAYDNTEGKEFVFEVSDEGEDE